MLARSAMSEPAAGRLSTRWFWLAFLGLYLLAALPMLRAELPPLVDYPNHLARMHVLIEQPHSAVLQQYYEIRWRALPNLAMDLTVPALARIMPLEWAGKAFVLFCLFLLPAGTALLHRVVAGQWSVWPLFAFLLLYDHLLFWGFLNYLCGLGLALLAFALWLAIADRATVMRVAVGSICALVVFFAHLMACGVFALLVAGHEVGEIWRQRELAAGRIAARLVLCVSPFVIPAAILLGSGLGANLADIGYDSIQRKLVAFHIFEGHHPLLETLTIDALGATVALGCLAGAFAIVPALRAPLILILLAHFLAPRQLMTAVGIDERLPLAFGLLLAAATVSTRLMIKPVGVAVAFAGLALFVARTAVVSADVAYANELYPRLIAILDQVPRGGRLAVAFGPDGIGPRGVPIYHLPALAVIRRDAYVLTFFANATQQPVTLTPTSSLPNAASPAELWAMVMAGGNAEHRLRTALAGFDALVVLDPQPFSVPPSPLLVPVATEPDCALYRIVLH